MKKRNAKNRKRPAAVAGAAPGSAFSEPPPKCDVNDPKWADEFTGWATRKAKSMGMDPIEMMGRALGLKKESDDWRKRRQAELRAREESANDIYGSPVDLALANWMQDVTSLLCYQAEVPHAHKESLVAALHRHTQACSQRAEDWKKATARLKARLMPNSD